MPKGIRPRVNEAREFLEIAKDFKDPKELIREALSNSWDAGSSHVAIKFDLARISGTRRKKIIVEIIDDGEGMSSEQRAVVDSSEIEGFFNLGDSYKPHGSIGSKGHGTKIYYKSEGIEVDTWKAGRHIHAETEVEPWDALNRGIVPTYQYEETDDASGKGTKIRVNGFQAKQSDFKSLDKLTEYVQWYTVLGSYGNYFGSPRSMSLELKPADSYSSITIPYGFRFPDEQLDLSQGTENACKVFGPETIDCGETEDGKPVQIQMVGALLGETHRDIVPHTYSHMGLWFSKDYIRIERNNELLENVFKGQYYYRALLLFVNCQQFDLTANRNNIRNDQEEYDLAVSGVKEFCRKIKEDEFVISYFRSKRTEDEAKKKEGDEKQREDRSNHAIELRRKRINLYKGRSNMPFKGVKSGPIKEPSSEAETALLLQAMISSNHPGIDFTIGDYSTSRGVDLIVETMDKEIPSLKWVELVSSLEKLYRWSHPPEGYHIIVCYELGKVMEEQEFPDGTKSKLVSKETPGRYALLVGSETIDVYVLREILQAC